MYEKFIIILGEMAHDSNFVSNVIDNLIVYVIDFFCSHYIYRMLNLLRTSGTNPDLY